MLDFKKIIASKISQASTLDENEIYGYIEIPPNKQMGDYAFPCFRLAKVLRNSPQKIAEDLKSKISLDNNIEKVEIVGGYLNFYINKLEYITSVLSSYDSNKESYGSNNSGNGKKILVEYSSPNIAKPFHIGHLRNTVIGSCLYNIYKYLGYDVTSINHLGDYGTQFGKMIEGYKRWGSEYDLADDPIEKLMNIYIRINDLCKQDENVLEICRDNFKKLENGDEYCVSIWNKFKDLSLQEFQKTYDTLNVKFDSIKGESFYADKIDEVVEMLDNKNVLVESQGAKIVDLESKGLGALIVKKSNDSSIYATRDLATILYRSRTYNFDRCIYVVGSEQNLYFKQLFEVAKYLDIPEKCKEGLEHVSYGMIRLTTGKMSTREGTVIKVNDLLKEAIDRVEKVIDEKNPDMENKKEEAKKIGIGAIIFNNLGTSIIKDSVFDWDTVLNFNGETGPYLQYVYVRTKSVLEKAGYIPELKDVDMSLLNTDEVINIMDLVYNFENTLMQVVEKNEPSILARYLIELGQSYSLFYNNNKIISDDKAMQDARVYLTSIVGNVLKIGSTLLGIEMPNKM